MTDLTEEETLRRLEEEGKEKGLHPRLLEFYHRLFNIEARARQRIGRAKLRIKKEAIRERAKRNLPLVGSNELALDWPILRHISADIIAAFTDYSDVFGELPLSLREAKPGSLLTSKMVRAWFKGAKPPSKIVTGDADDYLFLEAIIQATLRPFLICQAQELISLVDQENWRRKSCPVCGGQADFAFIDTERGSRWLVCSRCDTEWLFQRLQCPYCDNQNQDELSYFTDEEGTYRLYVCEQCHNYIKALDSRSSDSKVVWPLERVLTLGIDKQAQDMGYAHGHREP